MVKLFSKNSNLCDHNSPTLQTDRQTDRQTDGRLDRQTTCDRNTALCTKVHRAVKTDSCPFADNQITAQQAVVAYRTCQMWFRGFQTMMSMTEEVLMNSTVVMVYRSITSSPLPYADWWNVGKNWKQPWKFSSFTSTRVIQLYIDQGSMSRSGPDWAAILHYCWVCLAFPAGSSGVVHETVPAFEFSCSHHQVLFIGHGVVRGDTKEYC